MVALRRTLLMAKPSPVSPLAPARFPDLPEIAGVRLATAAAGIRYAGRTDVLLALFDEGTTVSGVFTRSRCPSAPVDWCRRLLPAGHARALVVNSGNANAFTGRKGEEAVRRTAGGPAAAGQRTSPAPPRAASASRSTRPDSTASS